MHIEQVFSETHRVIETFLRSIQQSNSKDSRRNQFYHAMQRLSSKTQEFVTEFEGTPQDLDLIRWYDFLITKLQPRMFIHTTQLKFTDTERMDKYRDLYTLFILIR